MQTLLNVTNAKVCASMVPARSFLAKASGIKAAERASWGMKATDSRLLPRDVPCAVEEEER